MDPKTERKPCGGPMISSFQSLCTSALHLALKPGSIQQNQVIEASTFAVELTHLTQDTPAEITDRIRLELDLAEPPDLA